MTALPPGFSQFMMSEAQISALKKDFVLAVPEVNLSRPEQVERIITHRKKVPGIYFWVMRHGENDDLFRIYLGKTNSLSYRVQNYVSGFQPHAPNDFKLRIFQSFLSELAPSAALDLLFSEKSVEQLTQAEAEAIKFYDPLLNRRQPATADARLALQNAFSLFYRSAFEALLQGAS
jgi:hypothetical protein